MLFVTVRTGHSGAMPQKIVVAPPAGATPATNAPELTVSELSNALKRTVEDRFGFVRVRGEISGYRGPVASGHVYFTLKDRNAQVRCALFRQNAARIRQALRDGMAVRVPTSNVSLLDLTFTSEHPTSREAVNDILQKAARQLPLLSWR